jgi:hypothetical protein
MSSNGNGDGNLAMNSDSALRSRILSVLAENNASVEQALKTLSQCAMQIRNKQLIEDIAKACKMELSGFLSGEVLELYYEVMRARQPMGYISKGWEDPGFRIGDLIEIPKSKAARFKATVRQIRKLCATNGIGITVEKTKDSIEIHMDGVIYSEGFNQETFRKTLETLHECVENVREMIG